MCSRAGIVAIAALLSGCAAHEEDEAAPPSMCDGAPFPAAGLRSLGGAQAGPLFGPCGHLAWNDKAGDVWLSGAGLGSGERIGGPPRKPLFDAAFSADGSALAYLSGDQLVLRSLSDGVERKAAVGERHAFGVGQAESGPVAWECSGRTLTTVGRETGVFVFASYCGRAVGSPRHDRVAVLADDDASAEVLSLGDGTVTAVDLPAAPGWLSAAEHGVHSRIELGGDGRLLVCARSPNILEGSFC